MSIPVKPIGAFYQTNKNGFLINPAAWANVPDAWQARIGFLKDKYLDSYGNKLQSLYLRGSLVRGTFMNENSDIDIVGLVSEKVGSWIKLPSYQSVKSEFYAKFGFTTSLELMVSEHSGDLFRTYPSLAVVLKTQGLCIFGTDITTDIPPFKVDKSLCIHYKWLEKDLLSYWEGESTHVSDKQSLIKVMIRTGFELVMGRCNQFTLDLYPAVHSFGKYYPSWKIKMEQLLYFYCNPEEDEITQDQIIKELGPFLLEEIRKRF